VITPDTPANFCVDLIFLLIQGPSFAFLHWLIAFTIILYESALRAAKGCTFSLYFSLYAFANS